MATSVWTNAMTVEQALELPKGNMPHTFSASTFSNQSSLIKPLKVPTQSLSTSKTKTSSSKPTVRLKSSSKFKSLNSSGKTGAS